MRKPYTETEVRMWNRWIGHSVVKRSGKPFKSGNKVGTVTAIGSHQYTPHLAYTMAEDGSQVECFRCELYVEPFDPWTFVYRDMLAAGVDPAALQHMVSKHISGLDALPESFDCDHARRALGNFEGELIKLIEQEATNIGE